jgi:hypothetical protein
LGPAITVDRVSTLIAASTIMWLAVAGGVVMIVFLIASWSREDPLERIEKEIAALADFNATLRYDQIDKTVSVLFDPIGKKFAVVTMSMPVRIHAFAQLVSVEPERNGAPLQLSRLIGEGIDRARCKPFGSLLNELLRASRSGERIRRLTLKILTDDLYSPAHEIVFFEHNRGLTLDDHVVKLAALELAEWHGRFCEVLRNRSQSAPARNRNK